VCFVKMEAGLGWRCLRFDGCLNSQRDLLHMLLFDCFTGGCAFKERLFSAFPAEACGRCATPDFSTSHHLVVVVWLPPRSDAEGMPFSIRKTLSA
jgi:hypothetical protein